jgi:flavin-dependent dehydrogenase
VSASADFRSGRGLAVRRTVLHRVLVERAEQAGVNLLWGTPVTEFDRIRAKWIVGADGQRSRVRTWCGLESAPPRRVRYGFRRHYRIAPWCDYVEVYWGAGLQIYIGPEASDQVCVTSLASDPHARVDDALEQFPELRERLAGCEVVSTERGAVTATRKLSAVFRGSTALVGDASGSVDAVTGAGVGLAFQHAVALVEAMEHGELAEYDRAHRRIMRRRRIMADMLLAMDRWPQAGQRTRQALAKGPWLFERLLAMHAE